jgi:hypothetical protein
VAVNWGLIAIAAGNSCPLFFSLVAFSIGEMVVN